MAKSQFKIVKRFKELVRPLSKEERAELKKQIERDGCKTPVTAMQGDVLIDGHHRDEICRELGLNVPFEIKNFESEDEAYEWAIRQQLGRRNLSPDDFKLMIGRLYNEQKKSHGGIRNEEKVPKTAEKVSSGQNDHLKTAEQLAEEHGLGEKTVRRAGRRAELIDTKLAEAAKPLAADLTDDQLRQLATKTKSDQTAIAREIRTGQKTAEQALGKKQKGPKKPPKSKAIDPVEAARRTAISYMEYGMRAIDDLHDAKKDAKRQKEAIAAVQKAIEILKGWK